MPTYIPQYEIEPQIEANYYQWVNKMTETMYPTSHADIQPYVFFSRLVSKKGLEGKKGFMGNTTGSKWKQIDCPHIITPEVREEKLGMAAFINFRKAIGIELKGRYSIHQNNYWYLNEEDDIRLISLNYETTKGPKNIAVCRIINYTQLQNQEDLRIFRYEINTENKAQLVNAVSITKEKTGILLSDIYEDGLTPQELDIDFMSRYI